MIVQSKTWQQRTRKLWTALRICAALGVTAVIAAACGTLQQGSATGKCPAFDAPTYVVKGKQQYDQDWIDSNTEAGVGACGWQRPKPRPPELDAARPVNPTVGKTPIKRKGIIARAKQRVKEIIRRQPQPRPPAAGSVDVIEPAQPAPVQTFEKIVHPDPPPVPAPAPQRSQQDRLLDPTDAVTKPPVKTHCWLFC
jgi:hypothetical protein